MRAYILCGGFGTRLQSVLQGSQKALVNVHGEPFLLQVLRQLARAGVNDAVLCAHYRADQVAGALDALSHDSGLPLKLVVETTPLGTGGALLNALCEHPPYGGYLVLNADTFLAADAYRMLIKAEGCALVAAHVVERDRYGSLEVDGQGRLLSLCEKGAVGAGQVNAGVYAFTEQSFAAEPVRACSLEGELFPELLVRETVTVQAYTGVFIDIGTPDALERYIVEFPPETVR